MFLSLTSYAHAVFDMLTTREAQRLHATDEEQLAFAASEGRALFRTIEPTSNHSIKPISLRETITRESWSPCAILPMRSCEGYSSSSIR